MRTVAEFVVCDNQVKCCNEDSGWVQGTHIVWQSLAVANKPAFRNCLVTMCPNTKKADIPSSHDISTFIHSSFVDFLQTLKHRVQVSFFILPLEACSLNKKSKDKSSGCISTTMDLWSVDQTKASFMGITAHWIESHVMSPTSWSLVSEVIAFHAISGPHTGANLGRYFVSLCEHAGIVVDHTTKVCIMFSLFENCSTNPLPAFLHYC